MKSLLILTTLVLVNGEHVKRENSYIRYGFYKDMDRSVHNTRKVFGGKIASLNEFPTVAALLDRYWHTRKTTLIMGVLASNLTVTAFTAWRYSQPMLLFNMTQMQAYLRLYNRCSAAVIAPYWALTAAHCVTSRLAYIKYNSSRPMGPDGESSPILYLYRHPKYKVVQEDEGRGMDITLLHHDLGLIRSRDEMKIKVQPISAMGLYNPTDLNSKELTVLGFGKTQAPTRVAGEELFAVNLKTVFCDRGTWFHCLCGIATPGQGQKGVCSGDSGGPVVYRNVQVGVTSMGPMECASMRAEPPEEATSVFTSTFYYVGLINATITDAESEIQKRYPILPLEKPKPLQNIQQYHSVAIIFRIHIPVIAFSVFAMVL